MSATRESENEGRQSKRVRREEGGSDEGERVANEGEQGSER